VVSLACEMGKSGTECCAFGCSKRRKNLKGIKNNPRSDSDGSDDEESAIKRQYPRTFHS
jgi:hypothetical protein